MRDFIWDVLLVGSILSAVYVALDRLAPSWPAVPIAVGVAFVVGFVWEVRTHPAATLLGWFPDHRTSDTQDVDDSRTA